MSAQAKPTFAEYLARVDAANVEVVRCAWQVCTTATLHVAQPDEPSFTRQLREAVTELATAQVERTEASRSGENGFAPDVVKARS